MPNLYHFAATMLSNLVASPRLKALLWRKWYEHLAGKYSQGDWTFINYGFWDEEIENLSLNVQDASNRPFIGLYERVTRGLDLSGKEVLEVGSGRGGGAAYLARTKDPKLMLGLDLSEQATQLAANLHNAPGLRFQQGDALHLPLQAASFDIALNVESSHCYASMPQFMSEVARVLRSGGMFSWCDMRRRAEWDEMHTHFEAVGLRIEDDTDITSNVLAALDVAAPSKDAAILSRLPKWMHRPFADFAGMPGSRVYSLLQSGEVCYGLLQARRK